MTYHTIVADPPWHYERTGVTFVDKDSGVFTETSTPYNSMTVEEIAALPVGRLADKDAHLYLWTTQRYLGPAFDIVRAWGFTYACTLAWCKKPTGFNVGGTFMNTLEFVLFARRGSLPAKRRVERQWWEWSRRAHSAKPEAFIDLVESVSPPDYVELFARRHRLGWDVWGDESANTASWEVA